MPTNADLFVSLTHVKVNGSYLPENQIDRVTELTVEQSLHLPAMVVLRLHDVGDHAETHSTTYFSNTDTPAFPIGAELEVSLGRGGTGSGGGSDPAPIFKGEITAVELAVDEHQPPTLIVRGYDRGHRLHRGRVSKSYQNVSDSDVAKQLAQQAGLSCGADSTSVVHDYLYQKNQTNWEFLKECAARVGYETFVDDKTLHFRKPQNGQTQGPEPKLWENLLNLRVTASSAFQAEEVVVRAWDPQAKAAIVGTASTGNLAPVIGVGTGKKAASSFGSAKVYVVNKPVASQSEANDLAKAVYNHLDGTFIQAEGRALGDPAIKPGMTLNLATVGKQFSGTYYITSAIHSWRSREPYTTTFVVSGRQTNTLLELVERESGLTLPSVVTGIVVDNSDPDKGQGRVKVKFPWLADNDQSWWARIASPMAGSGRGFFFLPEVDDEVLVAFEHGDVSRPYVLGALWNGKDAPPMKNADALNASKVAKRTIKTRAGHVVTLDDTEGSELISIVDKTGKNLIKIESSSNKISIQADGDVAITTKGKTTVDAQQNVEVTTQADAKVKATGNVNVEATGNVEVKATGNANVEATGNATVKANANASVQAMANLDLKGTMVNLQADGTMSIKANGPLQIQGAMVSIN